MLNSLALPCWTNDTMCVCVVLCSRQHAQARARSREKRVSCFWLQQRLPRAIVLTVRKSVLVRLSLCCVSGSVRISGIGAIDIVLACVCFMFESHSKTEMPLFHSAFSTMSSTANHINVILHVHFFCVAPVYPKHAFDMRSQA